MKLIPKPSDFVFIAPMLLAATLAAIASFACSEGPQPDESSPTPSPETRVLAKPSVAAATAVPTPTDNPLPAATQTPPTATTSPEPTATPQEVTTIEFTGTTPLDKVIPGFIIPTPTPVLSETQEPTPTVAFEPTPSPTPTPSHQDEISVVSEEITIEFIDHPIPEKELPGSITPTPTSVPTQIQELTPIPTTTKPQGETSIVIEMITKTTEVVTTDPVFLVAETELVECVNARSDIQLESFEHFFDVYIGDNITVIDTCGEETNFFWLYHDLSVSALARLIESDSRIADLLADEEGQRYAQGIANPGIIKEFALLNSINLAASEGRSIPPLPTATPDNCQYPKVDSDLERWLCGWDEASRLGRTDKFPAQLDPDQHMVRVSTSGDDFTNDWAPVLQYLEVESIDFARTDARSEFEIYGLTIEHLVEIIQIPEVTKIHWFEGIDQKDYFWLHPVHPITFADPGEELDLTVNIRYGFQHRNKPSRTLEIVWQTGIDTAFLEARGRHARYVAPLQPGTYTVTASIRDQECSYPDECDARFVVVVRVPNDHPTADGGYTVIIDGLNPDFHLGERHGLHFYHGIDEIIALRMYPTDLPTKAPQLPVNYIAASDWFAIEAVDIQGRPIVNYAFENFMEICLPLPWGQSVSEHDLRVAMVFPYATSDQPAVVITDGHTYKGSAIICPSVRDRLPSFVATVDRIEKTTHPPADSPVHAFDSDHSYSATIKTNKGDIVVELFNQFAGIYVENFVQIANTGLYDNTIWHDVEEGFIIMGGRTGVPRDGYGLDYLYHPDMKHDSAGILSMLSNNSQFFITLEPARHLDPYQDGIPKDCPRFSGNCFPAFGKVTSGMEVALSIEEGDTVHTIEIHRE